MIISKTTIKLYKKRYLCLVLVMLSLLFIAALWSPAGKGLNSLLLFDMFSCVFVTFLCGIRSQVWYLIVSNPDLCRLSYFEYLYIFTLYKLPKHFILSWFNTFFTFVFIIDASRQECALETYFPIFHLEYMLWVLKRTVSMSQSPGAHKTHAQIDGHENNYNPTLTKNSPSGSMIYIRTYE